MVREDIQDSLNETSKVEFDISAIGSQLHTARILGKKMDIFQGENVTCVSDRELNTMLESDSNSRGRTNVIFRFLTNPVGVKADSENNIRSVTCERIKLSGEPYKQRGTLDDSKPSLDLPADLTITCVGYFGEALEGMEAPVSQPSMEFSSVKPIFDPKSGMIQNLDGCCYADLPFSPSSEEKRTRRLLVPGNYCSGWIKSGAKGIIDSTLKGAEETYNNMKNHILNEKLQKKADPLQFLTRKQANLDHPVLNFEDWLRLDKIELAQGKKKGKARDKFGSNESILAAVGKTTV